MDNIERTERTVSASKKKKNRQEGSVEEQAVRKQKQLEEAQKAKRSSLLYGTVGILCAVTIVFLVIWNTGMIQRSATAATVKDVKYTTGDMQYYFNTNKQSVLAFYHENLGMMPFSTNASTKSQVYNTETGETWYDYLMEQSIDTVEVYTAVLDRIEAEGFTLSEESQTYMDEQLAELDEMAQTYGYKNPEAYLKANYGPYITYDRFLELYEQNLLVNEYISTVAAGFEFTDADFQAYYEENADALDSFLITQFVVQAKVPTTDAEGNPVEMSEDEMSAAMETAKADAKKLADEIYAKLESGANPADLVAEYEEQLYSYDVDTVRLGSAVNTSYSDWAYDSARQAGDMTLAEYESSSSSYYYYVARYEGRFLDESSTADVRHILIKPEVSEGAATATDDQKAAAKAEAEALLNEFLAGEPTEENFAVLAVNNSDDGGSAANGGLISGISASSNYVASFKEWATDDARKAGDTGLVESEYGWHIMYYVGDGAPLWEQNAQSSLSNDAYTAWEEDIREGYEATTGIGMKFIQG